MGKRWRVVCILCLALIVTGCWDRVEIENRGFVIGIAIDKVKEKAPSKPKAKQRLDATYQFVVPGALRGGGTAGGGQGGEAFLNLSSVGNTMFEISRTLASKTSRSPYLEHMQIILVSEDVAKKGQFAHVMDFFLRYPEMRRTIKIMVVEGEARKALEIAPKNEKLPTMYIHSASENSPKNAQMLPEVKLAEVHELLLKKGSFVIPRMTVREKEVKITGAAAFQGHNEKMVGFLGEEETEGLNMITGEIKGGILEIPVKDNLMVYEIKGMKRSIQARISDKDQIEFTINIESEGDVGESLDSLDYLDPAILSNIEKKVAKEIERLTNDTIKKVHEDFKVDVLGLGDYLNQEHYSTWKTIKDDWDHGRNYFAKSKIRVQAKVKLRTIGNVNQTVK